MVHIQVWHQLGIDLIGPLKETPRGNKFILTVTDYNSKWAYIPVAVLVPLQVVRVAHLLAGAE